MLQSSQPSDRVRRLSAADIHEHLGGVLGPRYRAYRAAWAAAGPAAVPAFPVHLDLELRDNCNQRCVFCPRNTDEHPDLPYSINTSAELSDPWLVRLQGEAREHGLWSINLGAFAEPLINKNVFAVVEGFHAAGVVDSRIITNGLLLDRYTDAVFASGLVQLFVSIDAFRSETYTRQRGPGYERVVANLLGFLAERRRRGAVLPVVRVSFVVTEQNEAELDEFVAFWSQHVDFVDVQARTDYHAAAVGQVRVRKFHCIDPFRRLAVLANGDILPCCTFWGRTLPIGNLSTGGLLDAWRGSAMQKVRSDLLGDRCAVCVSCQSP